MIPITEEEAQVMANILDRYVAENENGDVFAFKQEPLQFDEFGEWNLPFRSGIFLPISIESEPKTSPVWEARIWAPIKE